MRLPKCWARAAPTCATRWHRGVTIGRHTHEHEMESMVIVSGRAVHIINGEEQILEKGDIIAAMPGDTHQIACLGDEPRWC